MICRCINKEIINTFIKIYDAMKTKFMLFIFLVLAASSSSYAQAKSNYFNVVSSSVQSDANYGVLHINADKHAVLISTIMAYGENVKGLTIQINNGFPFKLAPSQTGSILNYVGSTLNIVLQPGDKATVEFITAARIPSSVRHLYAACEIIE